VRFSAALPILAVVSLIGTGTFPAAQPMLVMRLCSGGTQSIPLPRNGDGDPTPCPGACHAIGCRMRSPLDLEEGDQEA
jgi:hypothetical protein